MDALGDAVRIFAPAVRAGVVVKGCHLLAVDIEIDLVVDVGGDLVPEGDVAAVAVDVELH